MVAHTFYHIWMPVNPTRGFTHHGNIISSGSEAKTLFKTSNLVGERREVGREGGGGGGEGRAIVLRE